MDKRNRAGCTSYNVIMGQFSNCHVKFPHSCEPTGIGLRVYLSIAGASLGNVPIV